KARAVGKEAVKLAPSDDARERFEEFLKRLETKAQQGAQPGESAPPDTMDAKAGANSAAGDAAQHIVEALQSNPIGGPKFVRAENSKDGLLVYMQDFPMSQMPPFAKQKFLGGLKSAVGDDESVKTIIFMDNASKTELERYELVSRH